MFSEGGIQLLKRGANKTRRANNVWVNTAKTGGSNHALDRAIRNTEPAPEKVNDTTARDFLQGVAHSAIVGFTAEELTGYAIESNGNRVSQAGYNVEQFTQHAFEAAWRKRTQRNNKNAESCW
jgi:hypothetical protein